MKYPHTSSHKLLVRLQYEIKLQHGTDEPIDRYNVWKASRQRNGGEYMNEKAKGERIVILLLLTKIILSLTC